MASLTPYPVVQVLGVGGTVFASVAAYQGMDAPGREGLVLGATAMAVALFALLGRWVLGAWQGRQDLADHLQKAKRAGALEVGHLRALVEVLAAEAPEVCKKHPDIHQCLLATENLIADLAREERLLARDLEGYEAIPRHRAAAS